MESDVRDNVAIALVNMGIIRGRQRRRRESVEIFSEVISRYKLCSGADIREQVAKAYYYKSKELVAQKLLDEAAIVLNEAVLGLGGAPEPPVAKWVKKSISALARLDRKYK